MTATSVLADWKARLPLAPGWVSRVASVASLAILGYVWWQMTLQLKPDDSYTFWHVWRDPSLYPPAWRPASLYVYSPAFAQAFWPLTYLSWPVLNATWAAVQMLVLIWMLGPIGAVVALAFPFPYLPIEGTAVFATINNGNPMILTAAAITLGLTRWPGAFAFVLLTKVTAGVGALYFAIRREWRAFGIAIGVTLLIAAISAIFAFNLWVDWIHLLRGAGVSAGQAPAEAKETFMPLPFEVRAVIGLAVVVVAAWRKWLWLVPVGCFLALPDIHLGGYAVLTAVPAIWLRLSRNSAPIQQRAGSEDGLGRV